MTGGISGIGFVGITVLIGISLLVSWDWRWSVGALALQYLAAFVFVSASWPLELAAVKLVSGWIAGSVLGLTLLGARQAEQERLMGSAVLFRVLAAVLILLLVMGTAPRLSSWAAVIDLNQAWASLALIGLGLLHLGLSTSAFRIALGLLTFFSGFEILYASVEASTLVAGLQAVLTLGIAVAGAYLMLAPEMEPLE